MATKKANLFIPQVLEDAIEGEMPGMKVLAGSGAVVMNDTMPSTEGGAEIDIPYFGSLGDFERLPRNEGGTGPTPALTPRTLTMSGDKGYVDHSGMAFEITNWAQQAAYQTSTSSDPYTEAARQMLVAAERDADSALIDAALTTPLAINVYNAGAPKTLDYDLMVDARSRFADQDKNIAMVAVHSKTIADLRKLKDGDNKPLLTDALNGDVTRIAGVPIIVSDRCPIEFPTITAVGTTPPAVTVTGQSKYGLTGVQIQITTAGARGVAVFKYSLDNGNEFIEGKLTAATFDLLDADGNSTGLTANFAVGNYAVDNLYTGVPKLTSLILKKNSLVYWRNGQPTVDTDKDILADSKVAAVHMYFIAHRYRRLPGGTRTGVVKIIHN